MPLLQALMLAIDCGNCTTHKASSKTRDTQPPLSKPIRMRQKTHHNKIMCPANFLSNATTSAGCTLLLQPIARFPPPAPSNPQQATSTGSYMRLLRKHNCKVLCTMIHSVRQPLMFLHIEFELGRLIWRGDWSSTAGIKMPSTAPHYKSA